MYTKIVFQDPLEEGKASDESNSFYTENTEYFEVLPQNKPLCHKCTKPLEWHKKGNNDICKNFW